MRRIEHNLRLLRQLQSLPESGCKENCLSSRCRLNCLPGSCITCVRSYFDMSVLNRSWKCRSAKRGLSTLKEQQGPSGSLESESAGVQERIACLVWPSDL